MITSEKQPIPVSQLFEDLSATIDHGLRHGSDSISINLEDGDQLISADFETAAGRVFVCDIHSAFSTSYNPPKSLYRSDFARRWRTVQDRGAFFSIQHVLESAFPDNLYLLFDSSKIGFSRHSIAEEYRTWRSVAEITGELPRDGIALLDCPTQQTTRVVNEAKIYTGFELSETKTVLELTPDSILHSLALLARETKLNVR